MYKLVKMFTRDVSLCFAQWWTQVMKTEDKVLGAKFSDQVVVGNGVTLTYFRLERDLENFKQAFFARVKQNPKSYAIESKEYRAQVDKVRAALPTYKTLTPDVVASLKQHLFDIYPLFAVCYSLPQAWADEFRAKCPNAEEIIAISLGDRRHSEGILEAIELKLRMLAQDELKKLGKPPELYKFLTVRDLDCLAEDKEIAWQMVENRKTGYVYCKGQLYLTHNYASVFKLNNYSYVEEPLAKKLTGTVAFNGGVVRGKARLLFAIEQIHELKTGEVLVAPMTIPDFLPAMKKAIAIVTDEGGITCHAAIVSRELKKPCVIGTKTATRSLKNGDEVQVDSTKGIVTKL